MEPPPPSKLTRALRVLLSPPSALVFAALLAWDASSLPFHTSGAHLVRSMTQPRRHYCLMPFTLEIAKVNGTWQVEPTTPAEFNVNLTMTPDPSFWWPVWNTYNTDLGLVPLTGDLEPQGEDRAALRLAVSDWLASDGINTPFTRHLRTGEMSFTVFHWWGLARNIATLLLVAGLSASLRNTLRWATLRRDARRQRRLCPHCAYPRLGLASNATCPECGRLDPSKMG